jgi:tetratricopeptide (TPR) repeat protein
VPGLADEIIAAADELDSVSPDAWYDRLDDEHAGLQRELSRLEEQDPERGLHLASLLWPYWVARGRLEEGRRWLGELLARTPAQPRTRSRAKALYGAGMIAFLEGNRDAARALIDDSLDGARELGDSRLEADALVGLARVAIADRDPVAMERLARESAEAARAAPDERKHATALHHVAEALRRQGRYDDAVPYYLDAIERSRKLGDRRSVALELHNLGRVSVRTGDRDAAAERFRESLAIAVEIKHERLVGYCLLDFADLAAADGEFTRAARLIGASDSLFAAVGAALDPEYVDDRERTREEVVQALEEGFEAEYEAGKALAREPERLRAVAREAEAT